MIKTDQPPSIVVPLAPVYDVYKDLQRLAALTNTLAWLTSEIPPDHHCNHFTDIFIELAERLNNAQAELESALTSPTVQ